MLSCILTGIGGFFLGCLYTTNKLEEDPSIIKDFIKEDISKITSFCGAEKNFEEKGGNQ